LRFCFRLPTWGFALLILFLLGICRANGMTSEVPNGRAILERVVKSRMDIRDGIIRVSIHSVTMRPQHKESKEVTVYFDRDLLRVDESLGRYKRFSCWGCDNERLFVWYTTEPAPVPGGKISLLIRDRDSHEEGFSIGILHPRWYGCLPVPTSLSHAFNPVGWLLGQKSMEISVEQVKWKDKTAWKLSWLDPEDVRDSASFRYVVWVIPDANFSIVRSEYLFSVEKNQYHDVTECDVAPYKEAGIWFPTYWRSERTVDGALEWREEGRVEVIALNEGVSRENFVIQSLQVPPGTPVAWGAGDPPYPGKPLIWDGRSIVPDPTYHVGGGKGMEIRRANWGLIIGVNVALLSAIASLLLLQRYFRLRQSQGSGKQPGS